MWPQIGSMKKLGEGLSIEIASNKKLVGTSSNVPALLQYRRNSYTFLLQPVANRKLTIKIAGAGVFAKNKYFTNSLDYKILQRDQCCLGQLIELTNCGYQNCKVHPCLKQTFEHAFNESTKILQNFN